MECDWQDSFLVVVYMNFRTLMDKCSPIGYNNHIHNILYRTFLRNGKMMQTNFKKFLIFPNRI